MQSAPSGSWLDIRCTCPDLAVEDFDRLLPFSFLADSQALEAFFEQNLIKNLLICFRASVGNLINEAHIHRYHFRLTISVITLAVHPSLFTGCVGILLEETLDTRGALIDAAARGHMRLHGLMVVLNWCSLTHDYLCFAFDYPQPGVETTHKRLHFVLDPSPSVVLHGFILSKFRGTI